MIGNLFGPFALEERKLLLFEFQGGNTKQKQFFKRGLRVAVNRV